MPDRAVTDKIAHQGLPDSFSSSSRLSIYNLLINGKPQAEGFKYKREINLHINDVA